MFHFGLPAFGPPPFGRLTPDPPRFPPSWSSPTTPSSHPGTASPDNGMATIGFGPGWTGKNSLAKNGLAQILVADNGQIRMGKNGLAKKGLSPFRTLHPPASTATCRPSSWRNTQPSPMGSTRKSLPAVFSCKQRLELHMSVPGHGSFCTSRISTFPYRPSHERWQGRLVACSSSTVSTAENFPTTLTFPPTFQQLVS